MLELNSVNNRWGFEAPLIKGCVHPQVLGASRMSVYKALLTLEFLDLNLLTKYPQTSKQAKDNIS